MMAPSPAGLEVRNEQRIAALERDLTRLETIVERLVAGMDAERIAMKESRQEVWSALKDLGDKMERSVAGLADEMRKLADRNAAVDAKMLDKQSQALGAVAVTRWIFGTAFAVGSLTLAILAYHAGEEKASPPEHAPHHPARPAR